MAAPVAELDSILQSMLNLKPPGVTGGKIQSLSSLCNNNVQSETVLIQRIYTHFKKAPSTHKLGVLYVVDSVTRAWVEQARKAGQPMGSGEHPADGTFAAGHKRVTELLPSFMNDIINTAPEDQKARISKLIDIWERGGTFPVDMLNSFRQKMTASVTKTTTPPGSPPKEAPVMTAAPVVAAGANAASNTSSILQALANMVKTTSNSNGTPAPTEGQAGVSNPPNPYPAMPQAVNPSAGTAAAFNQIASALGTATAPVNSYGGMGSHSGFAQGLQMNMPVAPAHAAVPNSSVPSPAQLQKQVQIIQLLQAQGIPQDQWAPVLAALMAAGGNGNNAPPAAQQPAWPMQMQNPYVQSGTDAYGGMRSPQGGQGRSRSRSPSGYDRRRGDSPQRRRGSPSYGRNDDRSDRYRQRSPNRFRRTPSPAKDSIPPPGPKTMTWDKSLPSDSIKVMSRTLFVGGVTSPEDVLRRVFAAYGVVQTCIVNIDKRHAFVKMISRADAVSAKEGMERSRDSQHSQLRTRWGVGFGPRDCSDYATGISIIPLHKLTEADRKWMVTAEYGGTGGQKLEAGMVVEEPDIEIGAGVSSKAISRRMGTDKGGPQGPRSSARDSQGQSNGNGNGNSNDRGRQRDDSSMNDNNKINPNFIMPMMPGMPMGFPAMPAGFQFPPGFMFPGAPTAPGQSQPPGAT